jgi:hypothetical protein
LAYLQQLFGGIFGVIDLHMQNLSEQPLHPSWDHFPVDFSPGFWISFPIVTFQAIQEFFVPYDLWVYLPSADFVVFGVFVIFLPPWFVTAVSTLPSPDAVVTDFFPFKVFIHILTLKSRPWSCRSCKVSNQRVNRRCPLFCIWYAAISLSTSFLKCRVPK